MDEKFVRYEIDYNGNKVRDEWLNRGMTRSIGKISFNSN